MKFLNKFLIATLAGAATLFVWGGISHMVLLKGIGFTHMLNEERTSVITAKAANGYQFKTGQRETPGVVQCSTLQPLTQAKSIKG